MAATIEIRFSSEAGDAELDRAMSALAPIAWAFELYAAPPRAILLALISERDPETARAKVQAVLQAVDLEPRAITPRAGIPASWIGWREQARLVQVGPIWISLSPNARPPAGARVLDIESKNAFGSGLHETTHMCLERILELSPIASDVLDVGSGSGILSFAALSLGAKSAVGIEIDRAAIRTAEENAAKNGFGERYRATDAPPDSLGRTFDLVFANIISRVLIELAPRIASCVAPGGLLVLSGLRALDVEEVTKTYGALGLERGPEKERGGWIRVELTRKRSEHV